VHSDNKSCLSWVPFGLGSSQAVYTLSVSSPQSSAEVIGSNREARWMSSSGVKLADLRGEQGGALHVTEPTDAPFRETMR
jgi:hypothetical protein